MEFVAEVLRRVGIETRPNARQISEQVDRARVAALNFRDPSSGQRSVPIVIRAEERAKRARRPRGVAKVGRDDVQTGFRGPLRQSPQVDHLIQVSDSPTPKALFRATLSYLPFLHLLSLPPKLTLATPLLLAPLIAPPAIWLSPAISPDVYSRPQRAPLRPWRWPRSSTTWPRCTQTRSQELETTG